MRNRSIPAHPMVTRAIMDAGSSGFLFGGGRAWRAGTITDKVSAALDGPWTCHKLRHAFATEVYAESGQDLILTQELLGHANPAITRRYVLVDDARKTSVVTGLALKPTAA